MWTQFLKRHLDKFTSTLSEGVVGSMDPSEIKFVERLELTGGEEKDIINLFIDVICNGAPEDLIR